MNHSRLWRGVGAGVLAGAAVGLLVTPERNHKGNRHMAGRALRTVGSMIDTITDVIR